MTLLILALGSYLTCRQWCGVDPLRRASANIFPWGSDRGAECERTCNIVDRIMTWIGFSNDVVKRKYDSVNECTRGPPTTDTRIQSGSSCLTRDTWLYMFDSQSIFNGMLTYRTTRISWTQMPAVAIKIGTLRGSTWSNKATAVCLATTGCWASAFTKACSTARQKTEENNAVQRCISTQVIMI